MLAYYVSIAFRRETVNICWNIWKYFRNWPVMAAKRRLEKSLILPSFARLKLTKTL